MLFAGDFSANTPQGACPTCHGLGRIYDVAETAMVPDDRLTIRERAIVAWPPAWHGQNLRDILVSLGVDVDRPWRELRRNNETGSCIRTNSRSKTAPATEEGEEPALTVEESTRGSITSGAEQVARLVTVNQKPIGRTPRSNLATYTGFFDEIRHLFAATPAAKSRRFGAGRFSFNVDGGRCPTCEGEGFVSVELLFMIGSSISALGRETKGVRSWQPVPPRRSPGRLTARPARASGSSRRPLGVRKRDADRCFGGIARPRLAYSCSVR